MALMTVAQLAVKLAEFKPTDVVGVALHTGDDVQSVPYSIGSSINSDGRVSVLIVGYLNHNTEQAPHDDH